jgi:hypothetical protein
MKRQSPTGGGAGHFRLCGFWIGLLLLLVAVAGLTSCATQHTQSVVSKPGGGLVEYREIVVFAMTAMRSAQDSLEQLTVHPDRKAFATFAESVNRIEVDSIQIRARGQAMEARGDAYFEQWRERLARMNDESARRLAEERRDELKRSCDHIFQTARETRQTFKSFLAGLHQLRAKLEMDPGYRSIDSARALIASTQKSGHQVDEELAEILAELNSLSARLTASAADGPKQP